MPNLIRIKHNPGHFTGLPGNIPQSTNLQGWWRADSNTFQTSGLTTTAVADGDPVGGWVDISGASVAALQGITSRRGTLRLGAIGGKNAIQFVSSNLQFLNANSIVSAFSGSAKPVTLIVVFGLTA